MGRRKGREVEDGFNRQKKGVMGSRELKKRMDELASEIKKKEEAKKEREKEEKKGKKSSDIDIDDGLLTPDTYKLLEDMRAVYKAAGGKAKLVTLLKADDKALIALVKELMKIEASLLGAKLRTKENGGNGNGQATFVILKGLQDESEVINNKDDKVDLAQISDAINPSAGPRESFEEDIERPK